jgi:DNA-binding NarL/FixJ family response regulator
VNRYNVKVVLVEDSIALRDGLRKILSEIPGLTVCGEFEAAQEAISGIDGSRPDIVILDIGLKRGNGLEVLHHLNQFHPLCKTIVFSNRVNTDYREQAILSGASHVFNKFTESEHLFDAVTQLVAGRFGSDKSDLANAIQVQERVSSLPGFPFARSIGEKQCG